MTAVEQVERGVTYLDKTIPGWDERIKIKKLDIASGSSCVLGQLYGDYYEGREKLKMRQRTARSLGFNVERPVSMYAVDRKFDELTREWKRTIKARRKEQKRAADAEFHREVAALLDGEKVGV